MLLSEEQYRAIKVGAIAGRYINNSMLSEFLNSKAALLTFEIGGTSVHDRPVYILKMGQGPIKILMWSQMHGNETTTTKAVLDLIQFLSSGDSETASLLQRCTFEIIPILNPDGAEVYTRENANDVDLNRDALDLSQPESRLLRERFDALRPHFCFNLHDQRSIYNAGPGRMPATVSFLAPAHDEARSVSPERALSMQLIVAINKMLQTKIPGQVGRYDDAFNANCVGDRFQMLQKPTLLFEAGHAPGDYEREKTRAYLFYSLLQAIHQIAYNKIAEEAVEDYFKIPENHKLFFDVLIHNVHLLQSKYPKGSRIGILYKEVLKEGAINYVPYVEATGSLEEHFGHQEFNCQDPFEMAALQKNTSLHSLCF